ncbi:MAG TPA: tetratricopeptide repeat protein [Vicinamibacterales bacterium]|jgi:tetratricopeptide (TPR) repeat protein|nr:tetratricopeptide repeat protein [Vicinamibacterales bacterium]
MRPGRVLPVFVLVPALSACAPKATAPVAPVVTVPAAPAVDVAGLIRHGCFKCLERAADAAQGEQAFEVAALLTLRAKELGLPYRGYLARARALAPDERFNIYLEILDAAPTDSLSGDQYVTDPTLASATRADRGAVGAPQRVNIGDRARAWRDVLPGAPGSPMLRGYATLMANCMARPFGDSNPPAADQAVADREAPLLRYRADLCGRIDDLRKLREEDSDFVDADLPIARLAANGRIPDLDEALTHIQSAAAAFPDSLAIADVLGAVHEEREEWTDALAAFDGVIARMPQHRDALLGRTIALSRLGRYEDGMAAATTLLDLGSWYLGEAYYWRAWNEFQLQRYPVARTDTDQAKSLMVNAAVFVLSGLIEWNERRLATAEGELLEALKIDLGRCDAARYLGRVRLQRRELPQAIAAFKQAIQCFDLTITARQKLIADIEASAATPGTKARLVAGHERAIVSAMHDRDECVQNLADSEKAAAASSQPG